MSHVFSSSWNPADLEEVAASEEADKAAVSAQCPHLSRTARLEIQREPASPTLGTEVVGRLLEAHRILAAWRSYGVAVSSHHILFHGSRELHSGGLRLPPDKEKADHARCSLARKLVRSAEKCR
jgi:hypothetical protein